MERPWKGFYFSRNFRRWVLSICLSKTMALDIWRKKYAVLLPIGLSWFPKVPMTLLTLLEPRKYKNDSIQSKIIPTLKLPHFFAIYRHQPSQSRVDIEHWLKANTAWIARSITRFTSVLAWCYVGEDLSAKLVTDLF